MGVGPLERAEPAPVELVVQRSGVDPCSGKGLDRHPIGRRPRRNEAHTFAARPERDSIDQRTAHDQRDQRSVRVVHRQQIGHVPGREFQRQVEDAVPTGFVTVALLTFERGTDVLERRLRTVPFLSRSDAPACAIGPADLDTGEIDRRDVEPPGPQNRDR